MVPPGPGQPVRAGHEYERCGALALLACYDVHAVTATTPATTGIARSWT